VFVCQQASTQFNLELTNFRGRRTKPKALLAQSTTRVILAYAFVEAMV